MGLVVAAVVAFTFFDGALRWVIIVGGAVYEAVETYVFVRWSRRRHPEVGRERMIGRIAVAATALDPDGQVIMDGERWHAVSDVPCPAGSEVEIVGIAGLELRVRLVSGPRVS